MTSVSATFVYVDVFPEIKQQMLNIPAILPSITLTVVGSFHFLWAPAQRKRASMLYFANVFFIYFFMAALFSGPGERRFAKVLHVVDLECH